MLLVQHSWKKLPHVCHERFENTRRKQRGECSQVQLQISTMALVAKEAAVLC